MFRQGELRTMYSSVNYDRLFQAPAPNARIYFPLSTFACEYGLDACGNVPSAAQRSMRYCIGSSSSGRSISRVVAVRTK